MELKRAIATLLILSAMTSPLSASEPSSPEDPEVARKKAETARLTAEAALIKAQGDLAAAQNAQSPTVIEANRQKALAESRKAAAEADKAAAEAAKGELAALLPSYTSKPVDGAITADEKSGYFARLLAFDALRGLADNIVNEIVEARVLTAGDRIYLTTSPAQLEATGLRLLVRSRLDSFAYAFAQLDKAFAMSDGRTPAFLDGKESAAALAALPALVGVAADVAAFFRQDRSIAGKEVTVSDPQLMNQAVAGAWRRAEHRETCPAPKVAFLQPGAVVRLDVPQTAKLIHNVLIALERQYTTLCSARDSTDRLIAAKKVEQGERTSEIAAIKAAATKPPTPEQLEAIAESERRLAIVASDLELLMKNNTHLAAVLTSYRTFADSLLAVPTGDSQSPMAKIFLNDLIVNEAKTAYLLHVAVVSIGGEMEVRKWLWSPGRVRHRAGAVCAYTLFKDTGEIMTSGLVATDRQAKEGKGEAVGTFIKR